MKIDPVVYNTYSDDEEFASSEEVIDACRRMFPDTTESICKEIAKNAKEYKD